MRKQSRRGLAGGVALSLLVLAGCSQGPLGFNNAIANANKQLEQAGQKFGQALRNYLEGRGDIAAVRRSYEDVKKTVEDVKSDMKSLRVPESAEAKAFYDAHQEFLKGQEQMVNNEFAEIMKIVEGPDPLAAKQQRIRDLLERIGAQEEQDLAKLQAAQRAFATKHGIKLQ